MQIPIPARLAVALSLLIGLIEVLNQLVFHASGAVNVAIIVGGVLLGYLGIPAVVGNAFQVALAKLIPVKYLHTIHAVLAGLIAAGTLALTLNGWGETAHAIVAGVVGVLVGLGFGPAATTAVKLVRRAG